MKKIKIGFLGVGKIASALVHGFCTSEILNLSIYLSPRSKNTSLSLEEKYSPVQRCEGNQHVLDQSDIVIVSLRPDDAKQELSKLNFRNRQHVVSLVPFLWQRDLKQLVKPAIAVCRAIPLPTVANHNCPVPLYNADETVSTLFNFVGQPLHVKNEKQLHVLWTITGLISPFYDLLSEISEWASIKQVDRSIANRYLTDMFESLSFSAQKSGLQDFKKLSQHAATPGGMNEQAGNEISANGAHTVYRSALDNLLKRFKESL